MGREMRSERREQRNKRKKAVKEGWIDTEIMKKMKAGLVLMLT